MADVTEFRNIVSAIGGLARVVDRVEWRTVAHPGPRHVTRAKVVLADHD